MNNNRPSDCKIKTAEAAAGRACGKSGAQQSVNANRLQSERTPRTDAPRARLQQILGARQRKSQPAPAAKGRSAERPAVSYRSLGPGHLASRSNQQGLGASRGRGAAHRRPRPSCARPRPEFDLAVAPKPNPGPSPASVAQSEVLPYTPSEAQPYLRPGRQLRARHSAKPAKPKPRSRLSSQTPSLRPAHLNQPRRAVLGPTACHRAALGLAATGPAPSPAAPLGPASLP